MGHSKTKVCIIGAGYVGSSIAFAMAIKQIATELVIIDVNKEKAKGEALDISQGLPIWGQMKISAGDYSNITDSDLIIITAGLARKPGETRVDLAKNNLRIAKSITENIMQYYNRGVILVVSNPVDILTYFIQKWSGLPNGRVFGTGTTLDSSRFRFALSQKLDIDVKNIHGYIAGEHGDTQFPLWSCTNIAGRPFTEYYHAKGISFSDEDMQAIQQEVKDSGAEVIKNKGATYYAIAASVTDIAGVVLKNKHSVRTVSSVMEGKYGIEGVALSTPTVICSNGVFELFDLKISDAEMEALHQSADALKGFIKSVTETEASV
ncbi:MAG: L-lactate dehydrogenase [Clostridiales bacterium 43-6]|nr:MAG: L-lactate dehydrogenase [Clostridiales bacterium 43-6]